MKNLKGDIMSEKERERNPAGFFLTVIDGEKIYCTPNNSVAYLHEDPQYDHLFYKTGKVNEEGHEEGYYFWRDFVGDNFDAMIKYMINNGYEVENCIAVSDTDYQIWLMSHDVELPTVELTERQESKVAWLGYMLKNEILVADDFKGKGDLEI